MLHLNISTQRTKCLFPSIFSLNIDINSICTRTATPHPFYKPKHHKHIISHTHKHSNTIWTKGFNFQEWTEPETTLCILDIMNCNQHKSHKWILVKIHKLFPKDPHLEYDKSNFYLEGSSPNFQTTQYSQFLESTSGLNHSNAFSMSNIVSQSYFHEIWILKTRQVRNMAFST